MPMHIYYHGIRLSLSNFLLLKYCEKLNLDACFLGLSKVYPLYKQMDKEEVNPYILMAGAKAILRVISSCYGKVSGKTAKRNITKTIQRG